MMMQSNGVNSKALEILTAAQKRTSEVINVGDFVTATVDGSYFVNAYVFEIAPDFIVFQDANTGMFFDCERELAELTTGLICRYNRAELIAELTSELLAIA